MGTNLFGMRQCTGCGLCTHLTISQICYVVGRTTLESNVSGEDNDVFSKYLIVPLRLAIMRDCNSYLYFTLVVMYTLKKISGYDEASLCAIMTREP